MARSWLVQESLVHTSKFLMTRDVSMLILRCNKEDDEWLARFHNGVVMNAKWILL